MLFNSWEFAIFLPIVLALYFSLPFRAQNVMLLVASYIFYGWWDWRFLGLLLFTTIVDFFVGQAIYRAPDARRRKLYLALSIASNLTVLGFFKYFDFFVNSAAGLLAAFGLQAHPATLRVILPIGISFYTFQSMSYALDVYRGRCQPARFLPDFMLYVAFFPQLVAGPIGRAAYLLPQIERPRSVTPSMIANGVTLILIGYLRKLVIADNLAPLVERVFANPAQASSGLLLAGVWAFALQIYGDFAGYSDIARGLARVMGVDLAVNFEQPYFATSITEFWRRWHMSLSSWLRDYLYIMLLGGNRRGRLRTYVNLFVTMFLGGLWHGADWTFVTWGSLHGVYLAVEKALFFTRRKFAMPVLRAPGATWLGRIVRMAVVFQLVSLAWIFFRAPNFTVAFQYVTGIFTHGGLAGLLSTGVPIAALATLLLDIPIYLTKDHAVIRRLPRLAQVVTYAVIVLVLVTYSASGKTPFIYFQF